MSEKKGIIQTRTFYCDHIAEKDKSDIENFKVRDPNVAAGLENYIKSIALSDEAIGAMRTYLVRDLVTDELVAYFSLKSGMVSINEREILNEEGKLETTFDTVPGIEIANFAVNYEYVRDHPDWKGIGLIVFRDFIRELASRVAAISGTMVLYIFALPFESLIKRYHDKYKFLRLDEAEEKDLHNRIKPFYDRSCVFMYQIL
ncbi:hypothetical protein SAMN05216349_1476 [Oribacterium sp. KHPX15]|uniref:hypothetical protein n=1 Tax=Oribacterium sp. KHPX15 TaxID=1855342 RepID=UPI0008947CF8|nr:hypothetical protein [Oribacterium sp. KHPX15]SEA89769.1 hypothetical protein SAMN05216349_1476 [Oribacterium sp. KHPX15]